MALAVLATALPGAAAGHDWGNLAETGPPRPEELHAVIAAAERLAAIGAGATCLYWRDARERGQDVTPALTPLLYSLPRDSVADWAEPMRAVEGFTADSADHLKVHWTEMMTAIEDGSVLVFLMDKEGEALSADWAALRDGLEAECG